MHKQAFNNCRVFCRFLQSSWKRVLFSETPRVGRRADAGVEVHGDQHREEQERETAPEPSKRLMKATRVISADKVAEAVLKASARGRFSVIPGIDVRLQTAAYQAFPRIGHALVDRIARG